MGTGIEALSAWLAAVTGWEFDFMRRAALACVLLGLGAAPVGVFLMLRRIDWNTPAIELYKKMGMTLDGEWINCDWINE